MNEDTSVEAPAGAPPETPGQMTDAETAKVFHDWQKKVSDNRAEWLKYRAMYRSKFWEEDRHGLSVPQSQFPVKAEVNQLRIWLNSFVANLFQQQARSRVRADALVRDGKGPAKIEVKHLHAVQRATDRFLDKVDIEQKAKSAYELALLYPGAAFKRRALTGGQAEDGVEVVALPPWEAGWDEEGSHDSMRYAFHLVYRSATEAEEQYKTKLPEHEFSRIQRYDDRLDKARNEVEADTPDDLLILEFYDLTGSGQVRIYAVEPSDKTSGLKVIARATLPERDWTGRPLSPVQPVVLGADPGETLNPLSSAADQYRIGEEKNMLLTAIVNAVRRRLSSTIAYLEDKGVTKETLEAIRSGGDLTLAPVKGDDSDGDIRKLFQVIELPAIKKDVHDMMLYLDQARQDTTGMADQTRGKQGDYLTATESRTLTSYSELNAIPIRAEMEDALGRLGEWYLCMLRRTMKEPTKYRGGLEVLELTPELLEVEWHVEIVDSSTSPMQQSQRQMALLTVLPAMEGLVGLVDQAEAPFAKAYGLAAMEHLSRLFDLPTELSVERLLQEAKSYQEENEKAAKAAAEAEAAAAPPAPEQPAAPPMGPDEAAAVLMAEQQGAEVV